MTREPKFEDDRCEEWDAFPCLGNRPTDAAYRRPGEWQLVYDLRPLELIPYWLGIPFRPLRGPFAVIFDPVDRVYFTLPASKIASLGNPDRVTGTIPLVRILYLFDGADRLFRRTSERINVLMAAALHAVERFEPRKVLRHREVRRERAQVRTA